jgi:NDP-sugar pyrophosphorylase family protein
MTARNENMNLVKGNNDEPFNNSIQHRNEQILRTKELFDTAGTDGPVILNVGGIIRPLMPSEISTVSKTNQCHNWSKIRLFIENQESIGNGDLSYWLKDHITFNCFEGIVVIGVEIPKESSLVPKEGIHHNSWIENCIFEPHCRVYRNSIMKETHVGRNSIVMNNGEILADRESHTYGSLSLTIGPESGGGRQLHVRVESTILDVCQELGMNRLPSASSSQTTHMELCLANIIGPNCVVRDTPTISNIYMDKCSKIEAASKVDYAVLLQYAHISHGVIASNVLLQWHSSITNQSHVSKALLMECASIGPLSIVAESILGPDVHVSAGEVHSSLLGPNTNAHHQSLLIGVLWPLGRGNVGYGANVGSNHTGRLPDQECFSGEGTFWGLSTIVKFPVYMAPYSLVAAGTSVAPQRVTMPFSLLVDKNILPAWLLSHSPYTIARNEAKFLTRRKAQNHNFYTGWRIMRPALINLCLGARQCLQSVNRIQETYHTESDLPGIGQFLMTDKARKSGIKAYTACIRRYALLGLWEYMKLGENDFEAEFSFVGVLAPLPDEKEVSWPILPWEDDDPWTHQKKILVQEFPSKDNQSFSSWIIDCLGELVELENSYAHQVSTCKQRDDERGSHTIPNYKSAHIDASLDEVVANVRAQAAELENAVENTIFKLKKGSAAAARSKL